MIKQLSYNDLVKACRKNKIFKKGMTAQQMRKSLNRVTKQITVNKNSKATISAQIRNLFAIGKQFGEIDKSLRLKPGHANIIISRDNRKMVTKT